MTNLKMQRTYNVVVIRETRWIWNDALVIWEMQMT